MATSNKVIGIIVIAIIANVASMVLYDYWRKQTRLGGAVSIVKNI